MFEKRSSSASPKQQLRKSKSLTTASTGAKNIIDMTLKRRSTGCINRRSPSIYSTTSTTSNNSGKVNKINKYSLKKKLTKKAIGNLASSWIL